MCTMGCDVIETRQSVLHGKWCVGGAEGLVTKYSDSFGKSFHVESGSQVHVWATELEAVCAQDAPWVKGSKIPLLIIFLL